MVNMIKTITKYLKYSGIWVGFVFNPYHWEFKYITKVKEWPESDNWFDNKLSLGPVWIRVIIDDGRW
jgi:hypothetical protein